MFHLLFFSLLFMFGRSGFNPARWLACLQASFEQAAHRSETSAYPRS
jgi:hypothetical protein